MKEKKQIREIVRARRSGMNRELVRRRSEAIQRAVMAMPEWASARRVFLYIPLPGEVRTGRLFADCWKSGKSVVVPARLKRSNRYGLASYRRGERLKPGRFSVPEPASPKWMSGGRVDIAITPGVAFDYRGGRLGHGGGYYDRLFMLRALGGAFKAGLAFESQMVRKVPAFERDVFMDAVVTERGVFHAKKRQSGN